MELYHGSNVEIEKELIPHKSYQRADYAPRVYFSDRKEIAMLFSLNPIQSYLENICCDKKPNACSCHIDFNSVPIKVYELYDGFFEELFNKRRFIYVCEVKDNELVLKGHEVYTTNVCKIKEKIIINNVLKELQKMHDLKIIRLIKWSEMNFDVRSLLEDRISSRASLCESKEEAQFFLEKFVNNNYITGDIKRKFGES